jgi:phage terminase small subunit
MLTNAKVSAYIREKKEKLETQTDKATRDLLEENRRLSFSDARKLFNADGSPKAISELDDETAACIAGIEVEERYVGTGENRKFVGYTRKYKLWDKNAAHDKRFRWKGLFKEPGSTPDNPIQHKVVVEFKNAD